MNEENIYWLFSASAQSVSAFIALLLAGFAVVLAIMSNIEQRDDTLRDLLHTYKIRYHRIIILLGIITCIAVLLSLFSIYLNAYDYKAKVIIYLITSICIFMSIFGGIAFILYITNPDKYEKLARKRYKYESAKLGATGKEVDRIDFIQKFIELEKLVKRVIENQLIYKEKRYYQKEFLSFRDILDILLNNNVITKKFYTQLFDINNLRNNIVHGRISKTDTKLINLLNEAITKFEKLKMDKKLYEKLFNGQHDIEYSEDNKPIPIIRITKENNKYVAFNIKNPSLREEFDTAKEFLIRIGSPGTRPNAFDDQTGEDIFRGL